MLNIESTKSLQKFMDEGMTLDPLGREWDRWCHYWMVRGFESARNELVERNLRLAYHLSKKFMGQGALLEDLVACAAGAMIEATHKWQPERGMTFGNYAAYFVKNACRNQIRWYSTPVTLPSARFSSRQAKECIFDMRAELGRNPTPEEFTERSGLPMYAPGITLVSMTKTRSLDTTEHLEEGMDPEKDLIVDENAETSGLSMLLSDRELIANLMTGLDEREIYVVSSYFGIGTDHPMKLDEIGKVLGVSRQRTQQIRNQAVGIMKRAYQRNERFAVRARRVA